MSMTLYCQINGTFSGGNATIAWPDISGAPHVFPSTALFIDFATAIAGEVAALDKVVDGQPAAPLSEPLTIA